MTEIHYVNRVDQSPFQKLEGEKLAESETTQPDPELAVDLLQYGTVQPDRKKGFDLVELETVKTEYHVTGHVGETVVLQPHQRAVYTDPAIESVEQVDEAFAGPGPEEELPDDNIGNVASASTPDPSTILLASLLKDSLAEVEFKRQVIAAFKHLGLDTRKHFGV
jgi:hypothetical protein